MYRQRIAVLWPVAADHALQVDQASAFAVPHFPAGQALRLSRLLMADCCVICSDYTGTGTPTAQTKKDPRIGKRKPDVDLTTITDPAERRKQRRLAKNRATAATSR